MTDRIVKQSPGEAKKGGVMSDSGADAVDRFVRIVQVILTAWYEGERLVSRKHDLYESLEDALSGKSPLRTVFEEYRRRCDPPEVFMQYEYPPVSPDFASFSDEGGAAEVFVRRVAYRRHEIRDPWSRQSRIAYVRMMEL